MVTPELLTASNFLTIKLLYIQNLVEDSLFMNETFMFQLNYVQ